ncbi:unnamed protein product [Zymoseptoria tritici ST99CH_1A5]|uniref:Uncharacterized protein n=3 Tax=Zymoseptoria tritici TaxID=1047171 RepID=A0A1X7RNA4_ZYMT9|nr:unnamed protein product [Zymoseptoria tritici ST99CH_3D7]SMR48731.1 unnamed protein product [Zymoseptoria tritici ST99CH_1E4]SMR49915.1 unnamed protein product [Zymoseptoria tritici ST99CH_3D1]SMY22616.1 unnamed protein product [Zymoseptoria tritici ST99CH_1A5]
MAGPNKAERHESSKFAIIVATLSCVYNAIVAVASLYLPEDPVYIGTLMATYAWASLFWSVVGLEGALKKRPGLISSFAHFLLLDTFVSAISRLIILQFFFDAFYDQNVCSAEYDLTWSPESFHNDIVSSVQQFREDHMMLRQRRRSCQVELGIVQVGLVCVVVCFAVVQGVLAVCMRRHGQVVERGVLVESGLALGSIAVMDEKTGIACLEG